MLRSLCVERISRLQAADVLVPLVRRGIGFDPHLVRVYKAAARSRLRALAHGLGFHGTAYDLRSHPAGAAAPPRFELATDTFRLHLDPDRMMPGREVSYMRAEQRQGGWTSSPTRVEIGVLGDVARFARTLRRELHLSAPAQTSAF
ncbi:hypothetical protein [Croceicoccus marinus]|uniref:Uncharacterized protein n=1 Tax=Croceicoccus marinus TaxID=450378 RepID=A0A7G6W1C8_9SPHN|nr:hypothetical protein [Croceicoccus marinus]QNE07793.1 hypothetical protein H4O24_19805 [Croceicoccus marinus]